MTLELSILVLKRKRKRIFGEVESFFLGAISHGRIEVVIVFFVSKMYVHITSHI